MAQFKITDGQNQVKVSDNGGLNVQLTGSYVRHSQSEKPQGKEGDSLYEWDTSKAYLHDGTEWREI